MIEIPKAKFRDRIAKLHRVRYFYCDLPGHKPHFQAFERDEYGMQAHLYRWQHDLQHHVVIVDGDERLQVGAEWKVQRIADDVAKEQLPELLKETLARIENLERDREWHWMPHRYLTLKETARTLGMTATRLSEIQREKLTSKRRGSSYLDAYPNMKKREGRWKIWGPYLAQFIEKQERYH